MQHEIDSVVGPSRLPSFEDRGKLPYIEAVAKEIFRWNTITPNGILHSVTADDVYEGYRIPAKSIVISNMEAMLHDPRVYRDPHEFDPSRFLPALSGRPAERDPHSIGFGFGRRRCSGMRVADASIFIACAMVGAVFDVQKIVENGKVVEPVFEKGPGIVSCLMPFKVSIKLRSDAAGELLRER